MVLGAHLSLHPVALNSCAVVLVFTVLLQKRHGFVVVIVKHVRCHRSM